MKKTFVIPAVNAVRLTSCEDIMALQSADLAVTKTGTVQTSSSFADSTVNDKFGYWGGKKESWVE